jgi:hypothetical protein
LERIMATTLLKQSDCVSVVVDGKLGYSIWQILRDARNTALHEGLPLSIDVEACEQVESIGLGAIIVAQERLGQVAVKGCRGWLTDMFYTFGVCGHCTNRGVSADCPASRPLAALN